MSKVLVLIELDEEVYKSVENETYCGSLYSELRNGKVITGDCISRRVLKGMISDKSIPIQFEKEKRGDWHRSLGMTLGDIYNVIDNAPTW